MAVTEFNFTKHVLHMQKLATDIYRGGGFMGKGRIQRAYGGQVMAQAVRASIYSTSSDYKLNSFHCYFIKGVGFDSPVDFHVENLRDGNAVALRNIRAIQTGELMFHMTAAFKRKEYLETSHQEPMPNVTGPEETKNLSELENEYTERYKHLFDGENGNILRQRFNFLNHNVLELKPTDPDIYVTHRVLKVPDRAPAEPRLTAWIRLKDNPADESLSPCVVAYLTDMITVPAAWLPHPKLEVKFATSLEHSLWIHEDFDTSCWLLMEVSCPKFINGRSLLVGKMWTQNGRHVSSFVQEALTRGGVKL